MNHICYKIRKRLQNKINWLDKVQRNARKGMKSKENISTTPGTPAVPRIAELAVPLADVPAAEDDDVPEDAGAGAECALALAACEGAAAALETGTEMV